MSVKKRLEMLVLGSALIVSLTGCGTFIGSNVVEGSANGGIVVGEVVAHIAAVENEIGKYIFSIQNHKTEAVTLKMNSSQQYDYHIKDSEGNILHTYSANKSFLMMESEKVIKPGEILEIPVDTTEYLPELEAGTYTLDVWVTAVNRDDLQSTITFD